MHIKKANTGESTEIKAILVVPSTSDLLARGLGIINTELKRLQRKSNASSEGLDADQIRQLRLLIQSLVEVSAEERAISKGTDLEKLSDDELREMAAKLLKAKAGE